MRCQCNHQGILVFGQSHLYDPVTELPFVDHAPGDCRCTNDLRWFVRDGLRVLLCSCCWTNDDEYLP